MTDLIAGDFYTLSFAFQPDGGVTSTFQALFNGTPLVTLNNPPASGYQVFSFIVHPTTSSGTGRLQLPGRPGLPAPGRRDASGSGTGEHGTVGVGPRGAGFRAAQGCKVNRPRLRGRWLEPAAPAKTAAKGGCPCGNHRAMFDAADAPDADDVYAAYLRTCSNARHRAGATRARARDDCGMDRRFGAPELTMHGHSHESRGPSYFDLSGPESSDAQNSDARVGSLVRRSCRKRHTTAPVEEQFAYRQDESAGRSAGRGGAARAAGNLANENRTQRPGA